MTGPAFLTDANTVSTESMVSTGRMWAIDFLAKASFESACTRAFAADAMSMTVAVRHFTLVVRQLAFLSFPSGIAVTFAISVIASLIAQHRTDALVTRVSAEASITLTVAANAISVSITSVRAVSHHFAGNRRIERHFLVVTVVIVERNEPKTGFHKSCNITVNRGLISGSRRPRVKAAQNFLEVILGVGGQSVASRIKADRRASRDRKIKFHISFLSREELHVPVAVRGNHALQSLGQLHFGELCVVGGYGSWTRQIASCGKIYKFFVKRVCWVLWFFNGLRRGCTLVNVFNVYEFTTRKYVSPQVCIPLARIHSSD